VLEAALAIVGSAAKAKTTVALRILIFICNPANDQKIKGRRLVAYHSDRLQVRWVGTDCERIGAMMVAATKRRTTNALGEQLGGITWPFLGLSNLIVQVVSHFCIDLKENENHHTVV
jgi:hypothetical protein